MRGGDDYFLAYLRKTKPDVFLLASFFDSFSDFQVFLYAFAGESFKIPKTRWLQRAVTYASIYAFVRSSLTHIRLEEASKNFKRAFMTIVGILKRVSGVVGDPVMDEFLAPYIVKDDGLVEDDLDREEDWIGTEEGME